MFTWSRRALIRAAAFAAFGVLTLGGFCFQGWRQAENYRAQIEYEYQKSFAGLSDGVYNAELTLRKSMYASGTSMTASLAAEISRQAASARNDLGSLPFSYVELEHTARFLSQLDEWANALARQSAAGNPLSAEQRAEARVLRGTAARVYAELTALPPSLKAEGTSQSALMFGDNIKSLESEFSGLPTLIYDGPFSDHIEKRIPLFLENEPELDRQAAAVSAAAYLDVAPELLQPMGESAGSLPAYQFLARLDGAEYSVCVSKKGGYAVDILSSRAVGEPKITFDDAAQKAAEYLEKRGFLNMRRRYYTRVGNTLIVNFAAVQDNVVCYPDLIKVGVALDNGRIEHWEATGYLMNHTERDFGDITFDLEGAKRGISPGLFVVSAEPCVIPTAGLNEVCCVGLNCLDGEGASSLIYVNAQTGAEERILILLEDENGILTV
ncbi:germination protein YpeB [Clostridia bacterium]|nr:germination protein YpeB [Clostridia bacterium]